MAARRYQLMRLCYTSLASTVIVGDSSFPMFGAACLSGPLLASLRLRQTIGV